MPVYCEAYSSAEKGYVSSTEKVKEVISKVIKKQVHMAFGLLTVWVTVSAYIFSIRHGDGICELLKKARTGIEEIRFKGKPGYSPDDFQLSLLTL